MMRKKVRTREHRNRNRGQQNESNARFLDRRTVWNTHHKNNLAIFLFVKSKF